MTSTFASVALNDSRLLLRGAARAPLRTNVIPSRGLSRVAIRMPAQRRGVAAVGLAAGVSALCASAWASRPVQCEPEMPPQIDPTMQVREPKSIANIYELSFGTICGLCAGIFIKKGFKLIAGVLGGVYVLLQYFASKQLIKINWNSFESVYKSSVDGAARVSESASNSLKKSPPLVRVWHNLVDFLTVNFQQRATFVAGLVLGLRLG
ncbi:hypothetical protein MCUN1_002315 [Malassezia cuniculi]|uniref:FUN14 family protein n=1 Tax=Malassezia cuniculi TaxID=948313 RepID=A0AAF0JBN0_9BASI|nr:hypothetical protein MCUN1_002315 [Malassezia cuniculi]